MKQSKSNFRERICVLVSQIPKGRVMTYGQIAALCGNPRAARIVGGVAHHGDINLPRQRVVHKDGRLAVGFPGGVEGHKQVLEAEGVKVNNYQIDINKLLWHPKDGY